MNKRQNPHQAAFATWRNDTVTSDFLDMPVMNQLTAAFFAGSKFGRDTAEQLLMEELGNDE